MYRANVHVRIVRIMGPYSTHSLSEEPLHILSKFFYDEEIK